VQAEKPAHPHTHAMLCAMRVWVWCGAVCTRRQTTLLEPDRRAASYGRSDLALALLVAEGAHTHFAIFS
jgi:hypothetical protein